MNEKYTNNYRKNLILYWQQFYPNWSIPKGYHVHHIKPKCTFTDPTDVKIHHPSNLIALHPDDHLSIHKCRGDKQVSNRFITSVSNRIFTSETKYKIGLARKGKITMYNADTDIMKYVDPAELTEHIKQGFNKGERPKTKEHKRKISATNKERGIKPSSIGWNKGLTKETNQSIMRMANKNRGIPAHNKGKTNIALYGKEKAEKMKQINKTKDAIPVIIDNVRYYSIIDASRQLKITERKVKILAGLL